MTNLTNQQGEGVIPVSTYRLQFNKQFTFAEATRLVSYLRQLGISHCYASPYLDGRIKLFLIMQTLRFRNEYATLFRSGDYLKINVHGAGADQLLAFARQDQSNFAIIVVPRLMTHLLNNELTKSLDDVWAATWLELPQKAPRHYQELFSQCRVTAVLVEDCLQLNAHDALKLFPLAILSGFVE